MSQPKSQQSSEKQTKKKHTSSVALPTPNASPSKQPNNQETPARSQSSSRSRRQVREEKKLEVSQVVQVLYLNMQITIKVYALDTYQSFIRRVSFLMSADEAMVMTLIPVSKIVPCDQDEADDDLEEGKGPGMGQASNTKKSAAIDAIEAGTPNSFNKKDLVQGLQELQPSVVYYLVYQRPKTQKEITNDNQEMGSSPTSGATTKRAAYRKKFNNYFQKLGISIEESFEKTARTRGTKMPLFCPFSNCLREFQETGNLKTHLRIHTGERPFTCQFDDCGKKFITKGHLKTHELIHTGDKPFSCDICGKSYSRTGRLKIHKRTHMGEKPFVCDYEGCGKKFTEKGNLKTHRRIHNGEKPFACSFDNCGRTFTTHGHLSDHFRRHTGDRPFKCELCDNSFMRSSTLKIHMRRHTGEKPFECNVCSKKFAESGNLRTHSKIHIGALPNSSVPDKNFSSAAKLVTMGSLRHVSKTKAIASAEKQPLKKSLTTLFNETCDAGAKGQGLFQTGAKMTNEKQGGDKESPHFTPNNFFAPVKDEMQSRMTFVTPQTIPQGLPTEGMRREPSNTSAKITLNLMNSVIANQSSASQILSNSLLSGSNQSRSIHSGSGNHANNVNSALNELKQIESKRMNKAETKNLTKVDEVIQRINQLHNNSEPHQQEGIYQATYDLSHALSVERLYENNQNPVGKKAMTVERKTESSPSRALEKQRSMHMTAENQHETIKMSRDNSDRMLIEGVAEPTTPISHLINNHNNHARLQTNNNANTNMYNPLLGSIAQEIDKQIKQQRENLISQLQAGSSPQFRFEGMQDYSPINIVTANYNQSAQGCLQPHKPSTDATPNSELMKLVQVPNNFNEYGANAVAERTPRDAMTTPSNYNFRQQQSYLDKTSTNAQAQQMFKTEGHQCEVEQQYFEAQAQAAQQSSNQGRAPGHHLNLQQSFHTATFQQQSSNKRAESSSHMNETDEKNVLVPSESGEGSRLHFMKKNMSLNSQFDMKTPQAEGGLTKAINSFGKSQQNQGVQGQSGQQQQQQQHSHQHQQHQQSSHNYQMLTHSPANMYLQQSPLFYPQSVQSKIENSIQRMKSINLPPSEKLPENLKQKMPSQSFGNMGAIALAKLMQHHKQKSQQDNGSDGGGNQRQQASMSQHSGSNLHINLPHNQIAEATSYMNSKIKESPVIQYETKSPAILPTPLHNNSNNQTHLQQNQQQQQQQQQQVMNQTCLPIGGGNYQKWQRERTLSNRNIFNTSGVAISPLNKNEGHQVTQRQESVANLLENLATNFVKQQRKISLSYNNTVMNSNSREREHEKDDEDERTPKPSHKPASIAFQSPLIKGAQRRDPSYEMGEAIMHQPIVLPKLSETQQTEQQRQSMTGTVYNRSQQQHQSEF